MTLLFLVPFILSKKEKWREMIIKKKNLVFLFFFRKKFTYHFLQQLIMIYLFNFLVIDLKKNTQENTQEMATSPIKKRMKMYLK